jgi:hypothetical protein
MDKTIIALGSGALGIYLNHFLSTVRFRMELQADLIREVSSYLTTQLTKVVIENDPERAQRAYRDSTSAGEELLVRIGALFPPSVHALMKEALRGVIPSVAVPQNELLQVVYGYRETMRSLLAAMADAFTAWGRLRGWWESPRVVRTVTWLRGKLQGGKLEGPGPPGGLSGAAPRRAARDI